MGPNCLKGYQQSTKLAAGKESVKLDGLTEQTSREINQDKSNIICLYGCAIVNTGIHKMSWVMNKPIVFACDQV